MILIRLLWVFLKVNLFAIGGAYSFIPLLEKELVERYAWLTKTEFLQILGLVQVLPGAISTKYASYTGYKLAGIAGFISANLGNLIAPASFILIFVYLYKEYRQLPWVDPAFKMVNIAVAALLFAIAFRLIDWQSFFKLGNLVVALAVFGLFLFWKIHPAILIVLAALLGIILSRFHF